MKYLNSNKVYNNKIIRNKKDDNVENRHLCGYKGKEK